MSWSLKIAGSDDPVNQGDLVIGAASLATVTNERKLGQDLRLYVLERLGTDPNHPEFGSGIDGGTRGGRELPSLIATTDWRSAQVYIESEIRRIGSAYQRTQVNRAANDKRTYGKATLTAAEILLKIGAITFTQTADVMTVRVQIVSGRGLTDTLELTLPTVL
jgi:hypothetical protein